MRRESSDLGGLHFAGTMLRGRSGVEPETAANTSPSAQPDFFGSDASAADAVHVGGIGSIGASAGFGEAAGALGQASIFEGPFVENTLDLQQADEVSPSPHSSAPGESSSIEQDESGQIAATSPAPKGSLLGLADVAPLQPDLSVSANGITHADFVGASQDSAALPTYEISLPPPVQDIEAPASSQVNPHVGGSGGSEADSNPVPNPAVSAGLHINLIADDSVASAPAGFVAAVEQGAALLVAAFTVDITINSRYGWGSYSNYTDPSLTNSGGAYGNAMQGQSYSYDTVKGWLTDDATTATDLAAIASLPADNTSLPKQNSIFVTSTQLKALGEYTGDPDTIDGAIAFGTSTTAAFWVGIAFHEIAHAMGRLTSYYAPNPVIQDLFRYGAAGSYQWTPAQAAYFSVDGGQTNLGNYGTVYDYSDFKSNGVQGNNDPFNELYHGGTAQTLTPLDYQIMDAIGFDPALTQPDLAISSLSLGGSTLSFTISNIGGAEATASTTGIYLSTDATITTGDTLLTTKATPLVNLPVTQTITVPLPTGLTAGTYYLGAVADQTGAVSEDNEANNASSGLAIVLGNNSANSLTGTSGADSLFGLGGNDVLRGGAGADQLDGGSGTDTADYSDAPAGLTINLTTPSANTGIAAGDTYTAIENVTGGAGNDNITGNTGNNGIDGGGGNDTITGGAGNDTLDGGSGTNTAVFSSATTD
jgi:Ca2+-binding RTX toxin-like protein